MKKQKNSSFLWLDLEMTGLNAEHDVILEIAAIMTNPALTECIEGPSLVIHQPSHHLENLDPWVQKHHTQSGLLERVTQSTISVEAAESEILKFIHHHTTGELYFAGNSIYQDRTFLKKYMPLLNEQGHYRLIDVSTIKVLVHHWYPDSPEINFKKSKTHRALTDIYESIEELKHYKKYFFVP